MFESTNFHKGKLFCNNCKRFSKWYDSRKETWITRCPDCQSCAAIWRDAKNNKKNEKEEIDVFCENCGKFIKRMDKRARMGKL